MGELVNRGRHLLAAGLTVASMAREDPAWLTVQAARRTPAAVRNRVGGWATRGTGAGAVAVWGELLLDRPEQARVRLTGRPGDSAPRRGRWSRALAVHAGQAPGGTATASDRARWAWLTGDLDAAWAMLDGAGLPPRIRAKLAGDVEALEPGPRPLPSVPDGAAATGPDISPPAAGPAPGGADRPRVLHVLTNSLPWTRSGYTLRTQAVLTAQQQAGIEVAALTRPGYPVSIGKVLAADVDEVEGVRYHRCVPTVMAPGEAPRIDQWATALVAHARSHRATHLHSTTHYPNALAAQAAAGALGLPWVHEVRGQLERTWASARARAGDPHPYASPRFLAWRQRESELAAAADQVVTISETMRADLVSRGVAARRVHVVPNGIDPALLERRVTPADARRRLGLPAEGVWVGALSSVVHYEGLGDLVTAVAEARSRGLDVRAAVIGDGLAWPALAGQVRALGLEDVVVLPGRLPRDQALDWLDALDVVAIPRENHEVTRMVPPLKLVEAMGAGRPVIVSDLPALAELVTNGESGLLVPPQDPNALAEAIATLAADPAARQSLSDAGRAVAADRTWGALATTYLEAYATATNGRMGV